MAIDWETLYVGQIDPADAEYPDGKARNITVPGDGLGTPLEKAWMNDRIGFFSSLLNDVGESPSGNPDTVLIPQYLNALKKGRAHIDARAFGAKGDGATDDTTALQAAIDYAFALSGGGCVVFQAGTFVSQKLIVKTDVTLIGLGATIKLKDNSDSALLEIPVGALRTRIESLIFDGNAANNVGTPDNIGLLHVLSTIVAPTTDVTIDGCRIIDAYQDGLHLTDGILRFQFTNNFVDGTTAGDGLKLSQLVPTLETLTNVVIAGNWIVNAEKYCLNCDGVMRGLIVVHNLFDGQGADGTSTVVRIRHAASTRMSFISNTVENAVGSAVLLGAVEFVCANNMITNFGATGLFINAAGGADIKDAVVIGNTFIGGVGATEGIDLIEVESVIVSGNSIRACATGMEITAIQFAITGNSVADHTVTGILLSNVITPLGGTVVGNTIIGIAPGSTLRGIRLAGIIETTCTGNRVTDCADGIQEAFAADFNAIVGNVVRGNTTPITVVGAGTVSASNVV